MMALETLTRNADDPDAYVDRVITDTAGQPLTFVASVAAGAGAYEITATWQGDPAPVRTLRIPVASLAVGSHRLHLQVPGGNDIDLGYVKVVDRTN